MDLKSGFWQVMMAEKSHQYTAFTVGSTGVYEFLRMPYGLCNVPAIFQWLRPWRAQSVLHPDLLGQCNNLLIHQGGTLDPPLSHV